MNRRTTIVDAVSIWARTLGFGRETRRELRREAGRWVDGELGDAAVASWKLGHDGQHYVLHNADVENVPNPTECPHCGERVNLLCVFQHADNSFGASLGVEGPLN